LREDERQLHGTASLRPWHADYYQVQTSLTLEEIREFIHGSSTFPDQLEWQIETARGRPGLRFYVWRIEYIGEGWPVSSVARCIAQGAASGSSIAVSIRVPGPIVLMWFVVALAELAFACAAAAHERVIVTALVALLLVLEYIGLLQLRRRDTPEILAARLARVLQGTVTKTAKPPREPFRL
jgi:hypothetical protein